MLLLALLHIYNSTTEGRHMQKEKQYIKLFLEGYGTPEEAHNDLNKRPDLVEKNATVIKGVDGLFYVAISKTFAKQAGILDDLFDM